MIKYLILSFIVIGQAYASFKDIEVIQFKDQGEKAGISLLKKHFEKAAIFLEQQPLPLKNYHLTKVQIKTIVM